MHICHVISVPFPPEEGIGNFVYGLAKQLIMQGHQVTVITRGSCKKTSIENIEKIRVIRVPYVPLYPFHLTIHGFFLNKQIKKILKSIDILHIHSPLCPVVDAQIPSIITMHTPMLTDSRHIETVGFRSIIGRIMARYVSYPNEIEALKKNPLVTSVSDAVAEELQEYGLNKNQITVIRNGVDTSIFSPLSVTKNGQKKYILYTGRLSYRKGLYDFIESAPSVLVEYPDLFFLIPGNGELKGQLQRKVNEMGLNEKIKFLGFVEKSEIINLYRNATVFVMPSHYEGLPTVLLEAMACGLPVVATDIGGNNEVITSYQNGILVPPKSPHELANAIKILLNDEDLRLKIGRNARKTIQDKYAWDIIAEKVINCYHRALG